MSNNKRPPTLYGEELYIPFVGAIIERESDSKKEILIQTREKNTDKKYSGGIEIPGGKFRAYEDVYDTVRREVKEESGLDITFVEGENERLDYKNQGDTSSLIEPFCVTQMKEGPFVGLIFLCRAQGKPLRKTSESENVRWISIEELRGLVENNQEQFYTAFLAPIKKYLNQYE